MVLLLFGPPGCGKGTQARLISNWLNVPSISTGEMLRAEMLEGTERGRLARSIVSRGELVDDNLVNAMLADRIARPDCARGFLLDGYPRTVEQAAYLDRLLRRRGFPAAFVLHLDVAEEALVGRMTARRQCPRCSRIYNLLHQPPQSAGICDDDGSELITRNDDREDVFRERLRTYRAVTRPVLAHYRDHDCQHIRGDRQPDYVFEEISVTIEDRRAAQGMAGIA